MKYNELQATLQNLTNTKISITELADVLGVSRQNMHKKITSAKGDIPEEEIEKFEKAFGVTLYSDYIEIEHIHLNPSCGRGTIVFDEPEVTPIKLGIELIMSVLRVSNPKCLKAYTASGDSMEPIIENGDVLLVDTSRTDFNNGGIFLIRINNDWFVKRLRKRLSGELDVISDNNKYPTETFKPDDDIEIFVKGRIVKNLSRGL